MKQYAGRYELQVHENYAQYYKDITPVIDDDIISIIDRMEDDRAVLEIRVDGDHVNIIRNSFVLKFVIGEPCYEEVCPGVYLQVTSAFAGQILTVGLSANDAPLQVRDFAFTDKSLTITYTGTNTKLVARSIYSRIET